MAEYQQAPVRVSAYLRRWVNNPQTAETHCFKDSIYKQLNYNVSYFIIVTILRQEMLRPNPATNQTGFCCSISLSGFTLHEKKLLKNCEKKQEAAASPGRGSGPSGPRRGCCQIPTLWWKVDVVWDNNTTAPVSPGCSWWCCWLWHWASAQAPLDRWAASPGGCPAPRRLSCTRRLSRTRRLSQSLCAHSHFTYLCLY